MTFWRDCELRGGNVINALPSDLTHIYEMWAPIARRSLCGGSEILSSAIYETDIITCRQCMREYEGGADLEDVKLSGLEPEMTEEEYRRLFNLVRTTTDLASELNSDISLLTRTGKSFTQMTMEEKTDHIEFLNRCMRKIKVFKTSASLAKQEAMMEMSEAERAADREYVRKYKPQPRTTENRSPSERKAPQSPEDKLIAMLAKQLGSEEAAREFVAKQKAAKGK